MKSLIKYCILTNLICLFLGCDLFSTRTPEPPDSGRNNYKPPTSAQIVIDNFVISINEKNSENFLSCLADTNQGDLNFSFIPSAEAMSRFPELFVNWNKQSEFRTFNSITATLSDEEKPELNLFNGNFEVFLPDSAVYFTEYSLLIPKNFKIIETEFKGSMQITIRPNTSQLWSITRWIDLSSQKDSSESWSILKALFAN